MNRIEVNVVTGERTVVPLTAAEIAEIESRPPLPPPRVVDMRQARLALRQAGFLPAVNAAIAAAPGAAGEDARIEWEFAAHVERDSPLVAGFTAALGITEAQIDSLFALAATF